MAEKEIESLEDLEGLKAKGTVDFAKFFAKERTLTLGMSVDLPYQRYTTEEEMYFNLFYDDLVSDLAKMPEIAELFVKKKGMVRVLGEIFKAKLEITKTFRGSFPGANELGVKVLAPFDIRYVATADATNPAYSQYDLNKWTISFTAGTAKYLLSDGTNYYRPSPGTGTKAMIIVLGIVEVGTAPAINQHKLKGERGPDYCIGIEPIVDIQTQKNIPACVYKIPGVLPVFYDYGVMWGVMPIISRAADLRLLGVTFYEYDYYKALKWVS